MSNERAFSDSSSTNAPNGGRGYGNSYRGNPPVMVVVAFIGCAESNQPETSTATETFVHAVVMTQFVKNTEDPLGHNARIIQEDKAFVPQGILVVTTMDADEMIFVDDKIIVRPHHIKSTNKIIGITTIINNNPV
jgi:hypothetical protein